MERMLYRAENAFIAIVSLYVYLMYETNWMSFLFFLVLPKLILVPAHLLSRNTETSNLKRNIAAVFHSYSTVVIITSIYFLFMNIVFWSILGWVIHIAIDRVIKYKEETMPHPLFTVERPSQN